MIRTVLNWGQKRYHKETVWQRFCRTFGWTFWCDLPQNPCFTGQWPVTPSNCSENSLVLFVRFWGFVVPFWRLTKGQFPQNPGPRLLVLFSEMWGGPEAQGSWSKQRGLPMLIGACAMTTKFLDEITLGNVPSATTTTESLIWWIIRCLVLEEDKRATTNVQNRFVQFFFIIVSYLLFSLS